MARRKKIKKRVIPPDSIYNNVMVGKLINQVMRKGKKTIARKIVYGAFDIVKEKTKLRFKKSSQSSFNQSSRGNCLYSR